MGRDTGRLLAVTAAALILFSYGLGTGTLWDRDEALYTDIARQIMEGGDPFTMQVHGRPWFVHPPLFMWLQALTGRLVGLTEFTARLWSAISAAAVVAVTFLLARLLYDSRTALVASAVLATTIQFLGQARLAVFDPTLVAFMLAAFYMYMVAYTTGARRAHFWAWAWAGWATATKGPIGLILPALVVAALWTVRREWWRWREIPLAGPAIFAVIGLPWYVIETVRHGGDFLRTAVATYMLNRFFGVVENQPGPWWYYLPVVLAGAFPWTGYLPPAIVYHARRRNELPSQVILLWVGITLAFYSAAGTKLPNYILPMYPVLAIGIARLAVDAIERRSADAPALMRWTVGLLVGGVAIFVGVGVAFGRIEYPAQLIALRAALAIVLGMFFAGTLVALAAHLLGRSGIAMVALMASVVAAVPVLVHHTLPAVEAQRPLPRIARALRGIMRPDDALAGVQIGIESLIYYARHRVHWIGRPDQLDRALCLHDRIFLIVPEGPYSQWVRRALPSGVRQLHEDAGHRVLFKEGPTRCPGGWHVE